MGIVTLPLNQDHCITLAETHDRIRESVQRALRATGYPAIANLGCDVRKGVLELTGHVSSYYLKQVAQESVLRLKLEYRLRNGVVVQAS
jgi:hypothetical protein